MLLWRKSPYSIHCSSLAVQCNKAITARRERYSKTHITDCLACGQGRESGEELSCFAFGLGAQIEMMALCRRVAFLEIQSPDVSFTHAPILLHRFYYDRSRDLFWGREVMTILMAPASGNTRCLNYLLETKLLQDSGDEGAGNDRRNM